MIRSVVATHFCRSPAASLRPMAGVTPITTRTGIALDGGATITTARTAEMEAAAIGAALPVVADPAAVVVALVAATRVAATQAAAVIIIRIRLLLPQYLAIRVGAQAAERAEMIAKRRCRYIAVRKESTNQRSQARRQAARTRVRVAWRLLAFLTARKFSIKLQ